MSRGIVPGVLSTGMVSSVGGGRPLLWYQCWNAPFCHVVWHFHDISRAMFRRWSRDRRMSGTFYLLTFLLKVPDVSRVAASDVPGRCDDGNDRCRRVHVHRRQSVRVRVSATCRPASVVRGTSGHDVGRRQRVLPAQTDDRYEQPVLHKLLLLFPEVTRALCINWLFSGRANDIFRN